MNDNDLAEFIVLQNNLPAFREWQSMTQDYLADLGIMVQAVYSWHINNSGRYTPGAYVEPEHNSEKFNGESTPSDDTGPTLMEYVGAERLPSPWQPTRCLSE